MVPLLPTIVLPEIVLVATCCTFRPPAKRVAVLPLSTQLRSVRSAVPATLPPPPRLAALPWQTTPSRMALALSTWKPPPLMNVAPAAGPLSWITSPLMVSVAPLMNSPAPLVLAWLWWISLPLVESTAVVR